MSEGTTYDPRFGAALKRIRQDAQVSQRGLSQQIGYSPGHISHVEAGDKPPTLEFARACDAALRLPGVLARMVTRPARPSQLPSMSGHFVGRDSYLEQLESYFANHGAIVVIDGPPGVGKTALALHWAAAAERSQRFPDGILFGDLQGFTPDSVPIEPSDLLDDFLRALGTPGDQVPEGLQARTNLFRTLLADRRVLVVLDNAASAHQVRPLLAGSPDCGVVVTSRRRLPGLAMRDGAERVSLGPLPPDESTQLLSEVIGERATSEQHAVAELTRLCDNLPLALRVVGERVAAHPHHSLEQLAGDLRHARLDALSADDHDDETTAMRPVLSWSYHALDQEVARTFRLLGLHTGAHISLAAIGALAGKPLSVVRSHMTFLCGAHLVEEHDRHRYRLHDLVRLYAAERMAAEESEQRRRTAARRLWDYYLGSVDRATRALAPYRMHPEIDHATLTSPAEDFDSYSPALAWCDTEVANFAPVLRTAVEYGVEQTWKLAAALWDYFHVQLPWSAWSATNSAALPKATAERDRYGEAWIRNSIGDCLRRKRDMTEATEHFERALELRQEVDDRPGQGWSWFCLGTLAADQNQFPDAVTALGEALQIFTALDDVYAQGRCLLHRGQAQREGNAPDAALADLHGALERFTQVEDRHDQSLVWAALAVIYSQRNENDEAVNFYVSALATLRDFGDWHAEVRTLKAYGHHLWQFGDTAAALQRWDEAWRILSERGEVTEASQLRDEVDATVRPEGNGHDGTQRPGEGGFKSV